MCYAISRYTWDFYARNSYLIVLVCFESNLLLCAAIYPNIKFRATLIGVTEIEFERSGNLITCGSGETHIGHIKARDIHSL